MKEEKKLNDDNDRLQLNDNDNRYIYITLNWLRVCLLLVVVFMKKLLTLIHVGVNSWHQWFISNLFCRMGYMYILFKFVLCACLFYSLYFSSLVLYLKTFIFWPWKIGSNIHNSSIFSCETIAFYLSSYFTNSL